MPAHLQAELMDRFSLTDKQVYAVYLGVLHYPIPADFKLALQLAGYKDDSKTLTNTANRLNKCKKIIALRKYLKAKRKRRDDDIELTDEKALLTSIIKHDPADLFKVEMIDKYNAGEVVGSKPGIRQLAVTELPEKTRLALKHVRSHTDKYGQVHFEYIAHDKIEAIKAKADIKNPKTEKDQFEIVFEERRNEEDH